MTPLPLDTIPSCEGCGMCCTYVGVPPGFGKFYYGNADELPSSVWTTPDGITWRTMPEEVRAELIDYNAAVLAGTVEDRTEEIVPCLWFDETTRRCRHYEWRPRICRDFERGQPTCLAIRKGEGLGA